MRSDWKTLPLGHLVTLQRGHDLPKADRVAGSIPVMGSSGVTGYHSVSKASGPGVIVGRSGNSMGEVNLVEEAYWPLNTCLYITDFKGNDPYYIYYLLKTIDFDQFNSGSAQKSLNRNAVYPYEVKVTTNIAEQRKIGSTLQRLNQKVELNEGTNKTLESIAQTLFKSWFVDLDPVKAKMRGEQPEGMDEATAALFPDKLIPSDELGIIPEGWKNAQLKDLLDLPYGKALKKSDRIDGEVPVYGSGGITGFHNSSLVSGPSVIVGRKGTVGSIYREPRSFYPIDTVFYVVPKGGVSMDYCYLLLSTLGLKDMNTDAAVPGLNRNNAYRLNVPKPCDEVITRFSQIVAPIFGKIDQNKAEITALENLRDTLLPKLLSGELDLNQLEAEVA